MAVSWQPPRGHGRLKPTWLGPRPLVETGRCLFGALLEGTTLLAPLGLDHGVWATGCGRCRSQAGNSACHSNM